LYAVNLIKGMKDLIYMENEKDVKKEEKVEEKKEESK